LIVAAVLAASGVLSCGGSIDVGSDVLWRAGFEDGTFDEWTLTPGGGAAASSATGSIAVSGEQVHAGAFAAKLSIQAPSGAGLQTAGLWRRGNLPVATGQDQATTEAYYSAWYYVPVAASAAQYWVIFKLRRRTVVDDPATEGELFDISLGKDPAGDLTLGVYDHRVSADAPLTGAPVVVPLATWFQLEAYYRNAADSTGAFSVWFNGQLVLDLRGAATSTTAWTEWDVLNLGNELTPGDVTLFVDDCAVSRRRVGPAGRLRD